MAVSKRESLRHFKNRVLRRAFLLIQGSHIWTTLDLLKSVKCICIAARINCWIRKFCDSYFAEVAHGKIKGVRKNSGVSAPALIRLNSLREENENEMLDCARTVRSKQTTPKEKEKARHTFMKCDRCLHSFIAELSEDGELYEFWKTLVDRSESVFNGWQNLEADEMERIVREHHELIDRIYWYSSPLGIWRIVSNHLGGALHRWVRALRTNPYL